MTTTSDRPLVSIEADAVVPIIRITRRPETGLDGGYANYGPRVDVPDYADAQTKLLAFIGRTP